MSDYTVGQLIKELNDAHVRLDDSVSQINPGRVEAIARLVRRLDDADPSAGNSSEALQIADALKRAEAAIDTALEQRNRAREQIVSYRLEYFPGAGGGAGGAGGGDAAGGGATFGGGSGELTREQRRQIRKEAWAWADFGFAAAGLALSLFPGAPLALTAGFVIAKLTYSTAKALASDEDLDAQMNGVGEGGADALVDLLWIVAGELTPLVAGGTVIKAGIDGWGLLKSYAELVVSYSKLKDLID